MFKRNTLPDLGDQLEIRVDDLTVMAGQETLLDEASLSVAQGEYVAILGPSGSGKTLAASYMIGLTIGNEKPDSGAVYYNDTSIYDLKDSQRTAIRGRYFGYVPQKANLIPGMSAMDNITNPARQKRLPVDERKLGELFDIFELSKDKLEQKAVVLSGGERQRVSILRALAHGPLALVLDEPTAALNSELKAETNGLLDTLSRDSDTSIIVITHEDTTADRLIHLEGGRVIEAEKEGDLIATKIGGAA